MDGFEQSTTATLKIIEGACEDVRNLRPAQSRPEDFAGLHAKINGMIAALSACEMTAALLDFEVATSAVESIDCTPPGNPDEVVKATDARYKRAQELASAAQQQLMQALDRVDPAKGALPAAIQADS